MGGALTQGKGTPWGARTYGDPSAVSLSNYQSDPNKYQSFDRSDLANRAKATIGAQTGTQQANALGRLSAMGAGRSAGANRQLMDIAAGAEGRKADIENQQALAGWQDKLQQMAAENAFNQNRDQLALSKFGTEAGLSQAEKNQRRQALSQLPFGGIINLFGNY